MKHVKRKRKEHGPPKVAKPGARPKSTGKRKRVALAILAITLVVGVAILIMVLGTGKSSKLEPVALKDGQKASAACDLINVNYVKKELETDTERISGQFEDRRDPNLLSTCIYRTSQTPSRSVTITLRETKDEDTAKKAMVTNSKRPETESIRGLGDEAQYTKTAQQLMVRKGNRITTITVSKPRDYSKKESRDVAINLYKTSD